MSKIAVTYTSIDHCRVTRHFATIDGARKFAHRYVGEHAELGSDYAVSSDGVGKVTVRGATLAQLFPQSGDVPDDMGQGDRFEVRYMWVDEFAGRSCETHLAWARTYDAAKRICDADENQGFDGITIRALCMDAAEEMDRAKQAEELAFLSTEKRDPACTCSDAQLAHVGCDCAACSPF